MRFSVLFFVVVFISSASQAQLLTGYVDAARSQTETSLLGQGGFESVQSSQSQMDHTDKPCDDDIGGCAISQKLTPKTISEQPREESAPVDLDADNVSYDEQGGVVMASGNVIMVQDGRILRADEIRYFLNQDRVVATGNVVLNEVNGDIHFSQEVEFNDKLKNGFVEGLETYLNDGSRFTAEQGERRGGNQTIMSGASFTACEPCKKNPERSVPWRLRASEVNHDEEEARISYRNARFEAFGVPIAYTPYFSHADGSVKRKSGFLAPSFAFSSNLGASIENTYYWDIAPDKDVTVGLVAYTEQIPLGLVEYRQRWNDASLIVEGGVTYSDRTETIDDVDISIDDEVRGHFFADGLWDINDQWRSGVEVAYVSDDQYANEYDITNDDVLENTLYAERFSGRDYAIGQFQAFQDNRVSDLEADQPKVLPELHASFIGDAGAVPVIGGRWDAQLGFLSLFRDGNGQDVNRASVDLGWERRLVSDYGLVSDIEVSLRGDAYHLNDQNTIGPGSGLSDDSNETRFFPQIHMQSSYPVARNFDDFQMSIEPLVALSVAPQINENGNIPNEDSQDVQIDSSNLFNANRFPGLDVVEDKSRATYGLLTGFYGHEGSSAEIFAGQSYRFDNDDNPFFSGSGLDDQNSDIVGYINGKYKDRYTAAYRFQLDNDDITFARNELDLAARWDQLSLSSTYIFAEPLDGTEITENREQLNVNMGYYFNPEWRMRVGAVQDLGADPGLRRAILGLDYFGQCVFWALTARRSITEDESGESSTDVFFRIGLKNISDFETSGLRRNRLKE